MSVFGDMANRSGARAAHEHYFAQTVSLLEPGTGPRNVPAVAGRIRTETRTDEHGRQQRTSVRQLRFTQLTTVRHDATVTVEGVDWTIDEVLKVTASGLYVRLTRLQTHDVHRMNYRGKG